MELDAEGKATLILKLPETLPGPPNYDYSFVLRLFGRDPDGNFGLVLEELPGREERGRGARSDVLRVRERGTSRAPFDPRRAPVREAVREDEGLDRLDAHTATSCRP